MAFSGSQKRFRILSKVLGCTISCIIAFRCVFVVGIILCGLICKIMCKGASAPIFKVTNEKSIKFHLEQSKPRTAVTDQIML